MYKICATKKDLLEKTKQKIPFIYEDWILIVTDDFGEDTGFIGETVLITLPTASESEGLQGYYDTDHGLVVCITDRVYNGLIIQLLDPDTVTPILQAELHNIRANRNITKADVSNSTCSLSGPSADYADNRLIREEDIVEPPTFNIYYDSRNIKLTVVQNTGYSAVYHSYDYESNNIAERPVNKTLSDEEQKSLALTYYTVHYGDLVIINEYKADELIPVIDSIKDYTSLETIYSFSEESDPNKITRSFFATQECYVAYNLQDPNIHNILGAIPEIDCSTGAGVAITLTGCEVDSENDMVRSDEVVLAITGSIFQSCFLPTSYSKACAVDTPLTIHVINGDIPGRTYSLNKLELVCLQSNTTIDLLDGSHLSDLGENYYSFLMPGEDCQIEASLTVTQEEEDPEEPNDPIIEPEYINITLDETSDVSGVIIHGLPVNKGETIKIIYLSSNNEILISWDNLFVEYTINRTTGYCSTRRIKCSNLLPQSYVLKLRNIQHCCKYLSLNGPEQALSVGKFWDGQEIKLVLSEGDNFDSPVTLIQSVFVPYDITTGSNLFKNTQVVTATFNPLKQNFKFTEKSFRDIQILTEIAMENTNAEVLVEKLAFCNDTQLKLFPFDLTAKLGIRSFENTGFSELLGSVRFTIIPLAAFASCKQLTIIDYGETDITNIHTSAFENCSKLSSCILPVSLCELGSYSFKNTGITGIDTYPKYTSAGESGSLIFTTNERYENGMTVLYPTCFDGCLLKQVYLPSSIQIIESYAFSLQNSILRFRAPGLLYVGFDVFKDTWIERQYSSRLVSADIDLAASSGIDPMYKDQYGMIPNTEGVYFLYKPSDWNDGGIDPNYAFAVYLSPRVENDKLILYKIDLSLAKWDWKFWDGCRLQLHNSTISIADRAASAFWLNNLGFRYAIKTLYCNDGLLVIGNSAFYNSLLTRVEFPSNGSLTDITTEVFSECTRLASVSNFEKQTKLKRIGFKTFYNCNELTSISIPNSITYVGDYAFARCNPNLNITGIIWNKLTYIGIEAFLSNKKISGKLDLSNVSNIGDQAFEGCDGVTEIFFSSTLKSIPTAGFRYCSGLTSVNIGENVTHICEAAFGKCYNLSSITFRGTKAQWNAITKEKDWKYKIKATVVHCTDGDLSL